MSKGKFFLISIVFLLGVNQGVGLAKSLELFQKDAGRSFQLSSHSLNNGDAWIVEPGERITLADIEGPVVIRNIWFTCSGLVDPGEAYLRHLILRMYWDGEDQPSVEVPFGDFFGNGFARRIPWQSKYLGVTSGGFYCYLPMPFHKRGRIEVENTTEKPLNVFFHFLCQRYENLDDDTLYFHAQWHRENPTIRGKNYTILQAEGDGYFAGVLLFMQGYDKGDKWNFLESDEFIYIDGEKDASIKGTGGEDYFQGGWYFADGPFNALYHGLILKDSQTKQAACYRFHLLDRINFSKSIRVEFEHGNRPRNEARADFSSVAFWYQKEPHKSFPPLSEDRQPTVPGPAYKLPGALEWEWVAGTESKYMSTYNGGWSNNLAGGFSGKLGSATERQFTIPVDGIYLVGANFIANDHGAILQVSIDRADIGKAIDTYSSDPCDAYLLNANKAIGLIELDEVKLTAGTHNVKVTIVGKNRKARAYDAIVDCITINPKFSYSSRK